MEEVNKGGRPSLYTDEMPDKALRYLSECKDETVNVGTSEKPYFKTTVNLPSVEGLADYIGVNKTTLYEWESNHPEFSNALSKIKSRQGKELINKGLSGDYNSKIASMLLSANHNIVEKTSQDVTSGGETLQPLLVKFIDGKQGD